MIIWMVVAFLFILGPLAFLHELGHFWAAKKNGIKVEEFGFGIGPKVATLFVRDGTQYTIRAIPFAAFVRPAGEEDASVAGGMMTAPRKVRFAIAAAGPAANIVATLLILWVAYLFGPPAYTRVVITNVVPNSPAQVAGIQAEDQILQVDGNEIADTGDLAEYTRSHLGQEITLLIERDGESKLVRLVPRREGEYNPETEGPMGVQMSLIDTGPATPQGVFQAASSASTDFADVLKATVSWPSRIIRALQARAESGDGGTGVAPEEDLRYLRPLGILGILQLIALTLQVGLTQGYPFYILRTAGLISMALGMTNLLPLPGLDGGRILFVALDWLSEKILRRRISPEGEIVVHAVGLLVMILLMVIITWQDIVNPLVQFPAPTPTPTP